MKTIFITKARSCQGWGRCWEWFACAPKNPDIISITEIWLLCHWGPSARACCREWLAAAAAGEDAAWRSAAALVPAPCLHSNDAAGRGQMARGCYRSALAWQPSGWASLIPPEHANKPSTGPRVAIICPAAVAAFCCWSQRVAATPGGELLFGSRVSAQILGKRKRKARKGREGKEAAGPKSKISETSKEQKNERKRHLLHKWQWNRSTAS